MKILVLQDTLRSGGTERQSLFLTRAFNENGHPTLLLTFRPGGTLGPEAASLPRESLQPCDTGLDWFAPGLLRTVRQEAPDIVLLMGRMANCYGEYLAASLPSASVVGTYRTGKTLPWLYRRSLSKVRCVVANSEDARRELSQAYGVDLSRSACIHNSLLVRPPQPPDPQLRHALGAKPGSFVMLSVAMFRREKNQRALIDMASGLPASLDWRLWMVGDGPERAACEAHAASLGLSEKVHFAGLKPDPTPYYASADCAVHASWSEALSNFLIEAQSQGLPAVACQAQGISECFIPGETGWVVAPNDPQGFRSAVEKVAAMPPGTRAALADRARAFARESFDPQSQVAAYLKLFQSLSPSRAS